MRAWHGSADRGCGAELSERGIAGQSLLTVCTATVRRYCISSAPCVRTEYLVAVCWHQDQARAFLVLPWPIIGGAGQLLGALLFGGASAGRRVRPSFFRIIVFININNRI
jgi:hypothetical protein